MSFYACESSASSTILYLDDYYVRNKLAEGGISPRYARKVFGQLQNKAHFSVSLNDIEIATMSVEIADYMFWNWIPVLSKRGFGLAVRAGGSPDDFMPCTVGIDNVAAYMHLPNEEYDVVDLTRSQFRVVIPGSTPIYLYANKLMFLKDDSELPSCFRVPLPNSTQVLPDLFVDNNFCNMWVGEGLTGLNFREV